MNSLQTLSKWFYTALITLQIIVLILKYTGITVFGVNVSEWNWFWVLSPIIVYAGMKYLFGLSESLSNILNYLLGVVLVGGFIYLIWYLLTL